MKHFLRGSLTGMLILCVGGVFFEIDISKFFMIGVLEFLVIKTIDEE